MAADRRRRMVNTFDRENKPINAATVLQQVRRQLVACKWEIGRALRARPNSRTFDAIERVLEQLHADGKVKIYCMTHRGSTVPYYETRRHAAKRTR